MRQQKDKATKAQALEPQTKNYLLLIFLKQKISHVNKKKKTQHITLLFKVKKNLKFLGLT